MSPRHLNAWSVSILLSLAAASGTPGAVAETTGGKATPRVSSNGPGHYDVWGFEEEWLVAAGDAGTIPDPA